MMSPLTLVCFAPAGAGASFFHPWHAHAGDGFRVAPVDLPGREKRFTQDPPTSVAAAVEAVLPELLALAGTERRLALLGHSFGAVVAYESACALAEQPGMEVVALVVSGAPGPWWPRPREGSNLPDEEFLAHVRELAGYRHPAFDEPELRELLLPVLRADVAMHERYRPGGGTPLDVPIVVIRGTDDELVPAEATAGWRSATTRPLQTYEIPGDHMYLTESWEPLTRLLESALSGERAAS